MLEFDRLQKFISEHASYDSIARFPPPRCYPETRVEVLKAITDWIDDPEPREQIFWLNGPAGTGKSAITQTIAERLKDTQLAASFFFQRNTSDRGVADRLFLTLAWQLAMSIPEIRPYLESTLKTERSIHAKSIDVQFDSLFVQVFEKFLRDNPDLRLQKSLVVIDAVDECATDQDQRMILALIGAKMPNRAPLRFLISSRPEPHIKETFDTSVMKNASRALVLDNKFAPNDDIRMYLAGEFNRIFMERRTLPPPSIADITNRLVLISSGQFIYASTVVKFIDDPDENPEKQLDIILGIRRSTSSAYTQLDQLYIQILSQQQNIRLLKGVFLLILAFGQIDLERACQLLRTKKEDLKLKLRRLHSLLHVSDTGIKPYHLSLLHFLEDRKRAGKYHIHPLLVIMTCRNKIVDIPYAAFVMGGMLIISAGIGMVVLIADSTGHRWSRTVENIYNTAKVVLFLTYFGLVIWIWRRQKAAVIRGLLAESAV